MVHKPRQITLQCCIDDLKGHKQGVKYFPPLYLIRLAVINVTVPYPHLIILQSHEVVVYVLIASVFFHPHFKFLVVQYLPTVF